MIAVGGAALDASAGLVTAPFIADPLIRASNNVIQLSDNWDMIFSYFGGIGLNRVRLSSANSRIRGYPNLIPLTASTLSGDNPPVNDARDQPIKLYDGENVTIQVTNGAANNVIGLLQLARPGENYNINQSGLRKIRFTASLTSVAFGWGPEANVVLDDDLEAGTYNVYGFQLYEADAVAARLVFKNQVERPGTICGQLVTDRPWPPLQGGLGLLGSFESITPPFIQAMHVAAAVQAEIGYMLVQKA